MVRNNLNKKTKKNYLLVALLAITVGTGCAKTLSAPPSPEANNSGSTELQAENDGGTNSQEGIDESGFQEKGFDIQGDNSQVESSPFITESSPGDGPIPADEPDMMASDMGEGAAPDFDGNSSQSDFGSGNAGAMALQDKPYEADPFSGGSGSNQNSDMSGMESGNGMMDGSSNTMASDGSSPIMADSFTDSGSNSGDTMAGGSGTMGDSSGSMGNESSNGGNSFDIFANEETPPVSDGGASGDGGIVADSNTGVEEARLLSFKSEDQLADIHFDFDRYDLDDSNMEILRKNADWLKSNPATKVEIQGHCDERGTNNYNLTLGERRALATKKYLVSLGVEEDRLFTISYGEEKPFCFESGENCWKNNRRAHFMVAE